VPALRADGDLLLFQGLNPKEGDATVAVFSSVDGERLAAAPGDTAAVHLGTLYATVGGTLKRTPLQGGAAGSELVLQKKEGWSCHSLHVTGDELHVDCVPGGETPSGGKHVTTYAVDLTQFTAKTMKPCGCLAHEVRSGNVHYTSLGTDVGVDVADFGPTVRALPSPLPSLP
jgi:hypothetical protein